MLLLAVFLCEYQVRRFIEDPNLSR
jgi:hypothetical protein